jgi:hypothetical protein
MATAAQTAAIAMRVVCPAVLESLPPSSDSSAVGGQRHSSCPQVAQIIARHVARRAMVCVGQCSNLLYEVHKSHRCIGAIVHRNGVPWHPLHRRQRGIPMHSYANRSQIRALCVAPRWDRSQDLDPPCHAAMREHQRAHYPVTTHGNGQGVVEHH